MSVHHVTPHIPWKYAPHSSNDLSWFAVTTRPRFEKKVTVELKNRGVEVFLPSHMSLRQWSDRRRMIQTPLFPGYVFVRATNSSSARIPILRTDGVVSFVGLRGMGTPIPDGEIAAIQAVVAEKIPFEACPFLESGQRVRVRGGCLEGVEGILAGVRGEQTVVISVELIQRSVVMHISGYQIEPI